MTCSVCNVAGAKVVQLGDIKVQLCAYCAKDQFRQREAVRRAKAVTP